VAGDAEQGGRWIVEADLDGDGAADLTLFVTAEHLDATSFLAVTPDAARPHT
jgi:hypothetical protein